MIKCVIIDDEPDSIKLIATYIAQIPRLQIVGTATSPITGIELVRQYKADLLFLDIEMEEMNGIEVMSRLSNEVQVIFCTAYSEFAVKGHELNAVDYLMKPVLFERFAKAVNRVKSGTPQNIIPGTGPVYDDYIFVQTEHKGRMVKINLDDIYYVEAKANYVCIYTREHMPALMAYLSISDIENRLGTDRFIRIHKSFIVAVSKITSFEKGKVHLSKINNEIPLGRTYKAALYEKINTKILIK